jgi:insulysin
MTSKNLFIATNLDVEKKEIEKIALSLSLFLNDDSLSIWFKKDDQFWTPKANIVIYFRTTLAHETAEDYAKTRLYEFIVRAILAKDSHDAILAGLGYSVSANETGTEVRVSGFNEKLLVLLEKILASMKNIEDMEDLFSVIKEEALRVYRNWYFITPCHQISKLVD